MSAYGSRLSGITKELWVQWQQTKESWRDEKSGQFEQKYLSELVAAVDKSVTVIEQLDKLIEKIKKDCE
jgi:thymidylate synthase